MSLDLTPPHGIERPTESYAHHDDRSGRSQDTAPVMVEKLTALTVDAWRLKSLIDGATVGQGYVCIEGQYFSDAEDMLNVLRQVQL